MRIIKSGTSSVDVSKWHCRATCDCCAAYLELDVSDVRYRTRAVDQVYVGETRRVPVYEFTCPECDQVNELDNLPDHVKRHVASKGLASYGSSLRNRVSSTSHPVKPPA